MTVLDAGNGRGGGRAISGLLRSLTFDRKFFGRPYLISPLADALMAGGAACLVIGLFSLLFPSGRPGGLGQDVVVQTAAVFAFLSYFVNFPHFMASYGLLYGNLNQRMAALPRGDGLWWRYLNAAYVVPAALVLFFAWAIANNAVEALGYSVHLMFFTVGWHYVKQSYGVLMALSGMKGIFYSPREALILRAHAYSIWLYSWYSSGSVVGFGQQVPPSNFWGVAYAPIPFYREDWSLALVYWIAVALAVAAYGVLGWNWFRTKKRPSVSGLLGYTSMYFLFAYVRIHPLFTYAAPMFHSLQYLLFVAAYKRGEWTLEGDGHHHHDQPAGPKKPWLRWLTYAFLITATGALAFDVLPFYFATKATRWGIAIPAIFIFHVFINTHHYFIDNVIWRRGNRDVGRYLTA